MKHFKRVFATAAALLMTAASAFCPVYGLSGYPVSIGSGSGSAVIIPASGSTGAVITIGQGSVNKDMSAGEHIAAAGAGEGNVLASVNGALFNAYYSNSSALSYPDNCAQIMGMLMRDGEVICRGSGKNVLLGITDDGRFLIDRVNVSVSAKFRDQEIFTFWGVNSYYNDASAVSLFTHEMGYDFPLQSGAVAVRIRDNAVTAVEKGLARLECPAAGEQVAVFNANAWANACNWNNEPREGNLTEIVTVLTPEKAGTQEDWDHVVTALGCSPWLLKDGADVFAENSSSDPKMGRDYKAQRTFAAILGDGSLMIGECSGTTFGQIIDYLKGIGAMDAMALDGGASSTLHTDQDGYLQPAGRKLASMLHFVDYGSPEDLPGKESSSLSREPSAWAEGYVQKAQDVGLIPGDFDLIPRANITRAEFANLAVSLIKQYYSGSEYETLLGSRGIDYDAARAAFSDTYQLDVMQAYQMGIVAGKGNNTFDPNGSITRREAAVMLTNTAKIVGRTAEGDPLDYEDAKDIEWALEFVDFVTRAGIMGSTSTGTPRFTPLGYYSQEQALTTMCNLLPEE